MDENKDSFISQDQLQQLTQLIFARKRAKVCITSYVDFLQGKYLSTLSLVKMGKLILCPHFIAYRLIN